MLEDHIKMQKPGPQPRLWEPDSLGVRSGPV